MAITYDSAVAIATFTNLDDPEDKYVFRMQGLTEHPDEAILAKIALACAEILPPDGRIKPTKLVMQTTSIVTADTATVAPDTGAGTETTTPPADAGTDTTAG